MRPSPELRLDAARRLRQIRCLGEP